MPQCCCCCHCCCRRHCLRHCRRRCCCRVARCAAGEYVPRGHLRREGVCAARACAPRGRVRREGLYTKSARGHQSSSIADAELHRCEPAALLGSMCREGICAARACAPRGPLHKKRAGPPEQAGNSGRCLRLEGVWGASPRGRGAFAHVNLHPSSATLRSASTLQQAEQTCNTRRRRCGACERSLQPAHF